MSLFGMEDIKVSLGQAKRAARKLTRTHFVVSMVIQFYPSSHP